MTFIEKLKRAMLLVLVALMMVTSAVAQTSKVDDRHTDNQVICLTQTAYHEARGQSATGKIAVMNVVMNRSHDPKFPPTPCGVVHQKNGSKCQFQWVCSRKSSITDTKTFNELKELAYKVYSGSVLDVTHGARFFHAKYVKPGWNYKVTVVIGSHIFYR